MSSPQHIFRWDLDKTYLKSEFDTFSDIVRTARLTAEERENVPGSGALMRAIRRCGGDGCDHRIFFISGSPEQLRTVLEKKFELDGFSPDGFVLKPTVQNILRGRFRAVRAQVGYKLHQLIEGRADAPIGTRETLFGDDAESDAFVYSLYADVVAGRVPVHELTTILRAAGTYQAQIKRIVDALEAVVHEDPVGRIVIHLDQRTPPAAFVDFFPRVVPIYNHLQTAIVLFLDGTLPATAIQLVGRELLDRYGFDLERLTNFAEDILRRRRPHHAPNALEELAEALRVLDPDDVEPARMLEADTLDELTRALVLAVAERAEYLLARPMGAPPRREPRRDYFALWHEEKRRQDEARRARKLAAKISRDEERRAAKQRS